MGAFEMVCADCLMQMVKKRSGFNISNYPPDSYKPVVQTGDLFECPDCGVQMYGSFGTRHEVDNNDRIIWIRSDY